MVAVLTAERVAHRRAGRDVLAVDELTVAQGERLAVLGPNGAGKTTLLRLLAAVEAPTSGRVLVDGDDPARLRGRELLALRRRTSYLPQQPALLTGTVRRNVELPLAWRKLGRAAQRDRAMAALDRLGVAHLAGRRAQMLSGGEAQRVALARALVTGPDVLLLDEPAAALDADARAGFLADVAHALADRRTTVVHVTHRAEEAMRLADRVAVLVDGRLRQVGTPADVLHAPVDATVARLAGYENVVAVQVDGSGRACLGDVVLLQEGRPAPGPAQLAVWATGLRLGTPAPGEPGLPVTAVRPGPGRVEVVLGVGDTSLVAHLPPGAGAPHPGQCVAVTAVREACAFVGRPG
jgi:ABC-type Fe3+/spermidine/putrescine transport system ATPase subunit